MGVEQPDHANPRNGMSDHHFLTMALELAQAHSRGGEAGPFGAVVVSGGNVLGKGWNQVVQQTDPTAHAEIMAIRDAARNLGTHVLEGATIYCSCEPCPMCLSAIYWARITRVVFAARGEDARGVGFDDELIAREVSLPWKERSLDSLHAMRDEGRRVLKAWLDDPDHVAY